MSGYSDWLQSGKSERVWLVDSMTAIGQFAYVNPLHRLKHWDAKKHRRVDCWQARGDKCYYCEAGLPQIHDYTYGLYIEEGNATIQYLSTTLTTHTILQRMFSSMFDKNQNPCDFIFAFTRGKVTSLKGAKVNGYKSELVENLKMFVPEVQRPSPLSPHQNKVRDFKWKVPEEIALKLVEYDGKPFNLIDLFIKIKELSPRSNDNTIKSYSIRLIENGVLDVRKAKEYR